MLSPAVQQIIEQCVGSIDERRLKTICEGVRTLSHLFTKSGDQRGIVYLEDQELLKAYLAYFFPVNLGKVQSLLDEQSALPNFTGPRSSGFRFLDVGSGPGTATLGIVDWLVRQASKGQYPIEGMLLDESLLALQQAETLWKRGRSYFSDIPFTMKTCRVNLEKKNFVRRVEEECGSHFDLIFIGNTLNELFLNRTDRVRKQAHMIKSLWPVLAPEGSLVMMEPALRSHARGLHELRDRLLKENMGTVFSPCLHEEPCPALTNPKDWCHEERPWTPPRLVSEIDKRVGFEKDTLKFSYVIFRKDGRTIVPRDSNRLRIVSERMHHKGEQRVWVCQKSGRYQIGRLDREQSGTNEAFERLERGDIVDIDPVIRRNENGTEKAVGRVLSTGTVSPIREIPRC